MNWIVLIFGSGLAFFLGVGCLLTAVAVSFAKWRIAASLASILAILGLAVVLLSGTPLPNWYLSLASLLSGAWLVGLPIAAFSPLAARLLPGLICGVWLGGAFLELPYQFAPQVPSVSTRRLFLFGDSLAAGTGGAIESNWPELLARLHHLELANYSQAGATSAIALKKAKDVELGEGVVLLEIGGNDLLGSTTPEEFERNLEALLKTLSGPGRQVVIFELPLPPLYNAFGRIQRHIAHRFHATLIPKRILAQVISTSGATSDSLHLTEAGHRQLADAVWPIIGPAFQPGID